jgi:ABC-type sugar transport system substrate-binding protein
MMNIKTILATTVIAATVAMAGPAAAQERSYKAGSVWTSSRIKVVPGQFENYMDFLAGQWKRVQEFAKKEGVVLSYHVLAVNNARKDEPDLILLIETKDYMTTAQQDAFNDKLNAFLATDDRKQAAASAARGPMREQQGSTEYQELVLK